MKSFPESYFRDAQTREAFLREAQAWVALGRHANIVCARAAAPAGAGASLTSDYVSPDERGLNTLEGFLERRPPDAARRLGWAIDLCRGMEYAASHGAKPHGDLRPANLFIGRDGALKISDFGLARALAGVDGLAGVLNLRGGKPALSFAGRDCFGTPAYMAPEQFDGAAACDGRSDIYALGVILYQLSHGRLPFLAPLPEKNTPEEFQRYWTELRRLHAQVEAQVPFTPLYPVITRCLEKDPSRRYQSFAEARSQLEQLLASEGGGGVKAPSAAESEAGEWLALGAGLLDAGQFTQALECLDKALTLDAAGAPALRDKASALIRLGRCEEALAACDKALGVVPDSAQTLACKAGALRGLGRIDDSIACCDRALELDAETGLALLNRGICLRERNKLDAALPCFEKAIVLNPADARSHYQKGLTFTAMGLHKDAAESFSLAVETAPHERRHWTSLGRTLSRLDRWEEAVGAMDRALDLDAGDAAAWNAKAEPLGKLGRQKEALECLDKAIALDPKGADAWFAKALMHKEAGELKAAAAGLQSFLALAAAEGGARVEAAREMLDGFAESAAAGSEGKSLAEVSELLYNAGDFIKDKRYSEALICCDKAMEFDALNAKPWIKKSQALCAMGQHAAAKEACERALELAPHEGEAHAVKGLVLAALGQTEAAVACYDRALSAQPKLSRFLVDKARAEAALGHRLEAIRSLERFLALAREDQKDAVDEALKLLKEWNAR